MLTCVTVSGREARRHHGQALRGGDKDLEHIHRARHTTRLHVNAKIFQRDQQTEGIFCEVCRA
jgi:hypothetical protein